jgi:hypothetical protein
VPTCFDTYVSSLGSSSLLAELHLELNAMVDKAICFVSVTWRPGMHRGPVCTDLSGYVAKCVCTEELPDDDMYVSKHVGAIE